MATNVSKKSDIKLVVDFYECSGLPVDVDITPFEFKFYTTSIAAAFVCSYNGTDSSNLKNAFESIKCTPPVFLLPFRL